MLSTLTEWIDKSSVITLVVILLLSIYLITTFWTFLYRFIFLSNWSNIEKESSHNMISGKKRVSNSSFLYNCINKNGNNFMQGCLEAAIKESTVGLTILSIIASTSPFIGLFGTVVGILESFSGFKDGVTLSVIAPAISEALIATAIGILVAIPAYSFHLILKRKAFDTIGYLKMQIDFLNKEII